MADTAAPDSKGFFKSLYDFKFTSLIGERFLRFVYKILVILMTIVAVISIIVVLSRAAALVVPIVILYFFYVIYLRIAFEFLIVFFQIGDNVRAIRKGGLGPTQLSGVGNQSIPSSIIAARPVPTDSGPAVANTPAGWFDAPGDSTRYRYWDGTAWTEQYAPKGGSA